MIQDRPRIPIQANRKIFLSVERGCWKAEWRSLTSQSIIVEQLGVDEEEDAGARSWTIGADSLDF